MTYTLIIFISSLRQFFHLVIIISRLLKDKINRHIIIKDHMVYKDFVISQVEKINSKHKIKPRKTLLSVALTSGLKKISLPSFLIYIFLLISLYVTLNFDNIAFYFAKQSYEKYFNYDNMVLQTKLLPFYYEMGSVSVLGLIL